VQEHAPDGQCAGGLSPTTGAGATAGRTQSARDRRHDDSHKFDLVRRVRGNKFKGAIDYVSGV
jgi:hypothetical protein